MSTFPPPDFAFYAISALGDPAEASRFVEHALGLARAGLDAVQVRQKSWDDRDVVDLAAALRRTLPGSCRVLVNGRFDLALAAGADGVHLPADGLPPARVRRAVPSGFLIVVSAHSLDELRRARDAGADAATFGPIFATPGKGSPVGPERLAEATAIGLPLFALGGIATLDEALACRRAGARGVAAIRLFAGDDAVSQLTRLRRESRPSGE